MLCRLLTCPTQRKNKAFSLSNDPFDFLANGLIMRLYVFHQTKYRYPSPVKESFNEVRLKPISNEWQKCESCFVNVIPTAQLRQYLDLNGNLVHHFEIPQDHSKLIIESRSTVTTQSRVNFEAFPYGKTMKSLREVEGQTDARPYLQSSSYVEINPEAWRLAVDIQGESQDIFQTAYQIMAFIYHNFEYSKSTTSVDTHGNQALELRKGVCQDFAHAALILCRCLQEFAPLCQRIFFRPYEGSNHERFRGFSCMDRSFGKWFWLVWIGSTNNQVVDENYIVLGTGLDYKDVAPVTGSYFGKLPKSMEVSVTVKRLDGSID